MIFLTLIFSSLVLAEPAKIYSGLCDDSRLPFRGSALLFNQGTHSYALTSEHVLFHSNGDYCHSIYRQDLGKISATLVAAEYGNGLALLKLEKFQAQLSELAQLKSVPLRPNDPVNVTGYPYTSESSISNRGYLVTTSSDVVAFPLLSSILLLKEAHGEFGMSGGPLFDVMGGFQGILSHQKLELVPGGQSVVLPVSPSRVLHNNLFAIPPTIALEWVKTILSDPTTFFVREAQDQHQSDGREKVYTLDLQFSLSQNSSEKPVGGGGGVGGGGRSAPARPCGRRRRSTGCARGRGSPSRCRACTGAGW